MRVTFGSYGKTSRARTVRGAAPCSSWFAHSPAKHFAGSHAAGVFRFRVCIRPLARRQPVWTHFMEGPGRLYKRRNLFDGADARRLSVAWHGIRIVPF